MKGCPHGGGDERALSKNCCPESTVLPTRAGMKLLLAICQKQGTRSPYTGAGKTGGLSEYARLVGKGQSYITQVRQAAEVYGTVKTHYSGNMFQDKAKHLAAIHKADSTHQDGQSGDSHATIPFRAKTA